LATHRRHVRRQNNEFQSLIRFPRTDYLWEHHGRLVSPYAAQIRAWARENGYGDEEIRGMTEVDRLPIRRFTYSPVRQDPTVWAVGPNILDMIVKGMMAVEKLPRATQERLCEDCEASGRRVPKTVRVWTIRDPKSLWPSLDDIRDIKAKERQEAADLDEDKDEDEGERVTNHPFYKHLATGGIVQDDLLAAPIGFTAVRKTTSAHVARHTIVMASGIKGSMRGAYSLINECGEKAWQADLDRAERLWEAIQDAPGNILVEDDAIRAELPPCSISQAIEQDIGFQACAAFGIASPQTVNTARPNGRPIGSTGGKKGKRDEGAYVRLTVKDGAVLGLFHTAYRNVAKGTTFEDAVQNLGIQVVAEVLGAFRHEGLIMDADLLEGWLDAAVEDWRDHAAQNEQPAAGAAAFDPFETLGVNTNTPMAEVTAAFFRLTEAVQGLPNHSLHERINTAYKAIKAIHKQQQTQGA